MFGVIGLGQAGSNIAEVASKLGFLAGAINYSQKDLDAVNVKHKLRLLGSEGVGKNRDEAITLFQDQWQDALKFVINNFFNVKIIIFAFSASGGSGSGISPILLDVVKHAMPNTTFIVFPVLPEQSESSISQINSLKTFEELSKINVAAFPIDNQQTRNLYPNISKSKLFEITNEKAVSLMYQITTYTELMSRNGNFDEKDLLTILNNEGIATISDVELTSISQGINLTPQGVAEKVKASWNQSIFAPVDNPSPTKAAIIFDGQESLLEYLQPHLIFNPMTTETFEGIYNQENGRVMSILTGLPWSFKRLKDIETSLRIAEDQIKTANEAPSSYSYQSVATINRPHKQPELSKVSVMDILNKYKR